MAISGAFAGLAGAIDVLGWEFHIATSDILVSNVGFLGIAVALLGRNSAGRRLLRRAPLRRPDRRHLEPPARPERLRPAARREPDADHPGPRRALRRRRPARALDLARPQEGPDQADDGGRMTAAPITPVARRAASPSSSSARHVAIVGIVLGVVGALARAAAGARPGSVTLPLLLGILAVACGIWAVSRDVKRAGLGRDRRRGSSGSRSRCSPSSRASRT